MTGRTIPVTRTDDSEVASEATQELIKAKTDNLDIALSALRDALRGSGSKTNTDIVTELASIGGASAAAAGDTGASTTNGFLRWMRDFWLSLKGTKTAANSISVTGASDSVFYVGGVSADGVAPTDQAVRVGGVDGGGLKRTLLTRTDGALTTNFGDATSSSVVTLSDTTTECTINVTKGQTSGSWIGTAASDVSGMNIALYAVVNEVERALAFCLANATASATHSVAVAASANLYYVFDIPLNTSVVKLRLSSRAAGSIDTKITIGWASPAMFTSRGTINAALAAGTNRAGSVFAPGIWYDDTSAALTANSTFTSTARDVTATASGSAFSSASTNAKEYRVMAEQDVAFTLQIQASRDNSTFRIVESITAASVPGGGFVASASIAPAWRYYRYAIVNGGTSAARTTGGSIVMAI